MQPANPDLFLCETIGKHPAAIGWVLVSRQGAVAGQSTPPEIDAEAIGLWSLGIFVSSAQLSQKLGHERIFQIVSRTTGGHTMIITDLGNHLFITLSNDTSDATLIDLMRNITTTIAGIEIGPIRPPTSDRFLAILGGASVVQAWHNRSAMDGRLVELCTSAG